MPAVTRQRAEPVSLVAAGVVTPFGADLDAFWSGLITGSDSISMIERFPVDDLRVGRGGEIKKLRPLHGADLLRADVVDVVIAGGYDALCRFVMRGFDALRSLTRERVRPFDRRRSGLLLGEAAALVMMTREGATRGPRLGRLLGHASASDGSHIAAPDANGRGLELAARSALEEAGLTSADVDFVSAHGTGTPLNDRIEAEVLRRLLGRRASEIPVNSIKASVGHTMGAAAALEAVMCLLAGREGIVPYTLGLEEPDPACELDHVIGSP